MSAIWDLALENGLITGDGWTRDGTLDAYEERGSEEAIIDAMFSDGKVHWIIEEYLEADDLENVEGECGIIFNALCEKMKVYWMRFVRKWLHDNEERVRDWFNDYSGRQAAE